MRVIILYISPVHFNVFLWRKEYVMKIELGKDIIFHQPSACFCAATNNAPQFFLIPDLCIAKN